MFIWIPDVMFQELLAVIQVFYFVMKDYTASQPKHNQCQC